MKPKKDFDKKIALIAGALDLPILARDALRKNGRDVFVVGIKNFYNPKLKPDMEMRLGAAGTILHDLKKRGITTLTFVGAIGHPNLSDLRPDLRTIPILASILKNQKGYDSMAVALISEIEKRGFKILAAQDVAPELTFNTGVQTKIKPDKQDISDINRAVAVSKIMGREDIGASVVVDRQVIAVEAAEGTARMLERVITLHGKRKKSGGVFAKMTKPGQDLRIDIPAIGVDTVNAVANAKLRGIVVNAKTCFVVDIPAVITAANQAKIFIIAE